MPPLPALKSPVIKRLEKSLLAQPRQVQLECIGRAEMLALDVNDATTYPEDWVVFRLGGGAGGTSGVAADGGLIVGTTLRSELGPLVERLCESMKLKSDDSSLNGSVLDAPALCAKWAVSRSTLNRLRTRGLVGRRVLGPDQRPRLVFLSEVVKRFEEAHRAELARAGSFSRIGTIDAARLVKRAERYRRVFGWTLNQSAERLASKFGRSHEGVRQVLQRAAKRGHVTLREAPALGEDRRELIFRAWRRGVDLSLISRRTRRSRGAIRRAINVAKAERLRSLLESGVLSAGDLPVAPRKSGAEAVLEQMPVRTGLVARSPAEVLTFLKAARTQGPPIGAEEKARLTAYQFLRAEAARMIGKLDRLQPSATGVDRVETYLRWAARLKAELIRSQFRLMLDTLAARVTRPLEELPAASAIQVLIDGIRTIGDAVDAHDPTKAGRLAAGAGLLLDRYAAALAKSLVPTPAQARRALVVIPADLRLPDWEREVASWQTVVEPDRRLRPAIQKHRVPAREASIINKRYGWDGSPPRTLADLAVELKMSQIRVFQVEHKALATALAALRE